MLQKIGKSMRGKKYTGNLAFSFNNYRYIFAVPGLPNVLTRDWIILHRYYTFRVRWPPDPNEMPKTWNLSYVYLNITYMSKWEYFEAKKIGVDKIFWISSEKAPAVNGTLHKLDLLLSHCQLIIFCQAWIAKFICNSFKRFLSGVRMTVIHRPRWFEIAFQSHSFDEEFYFLYL